MGVSDWEKKLIGFGCDGASVNMGAHGLRGFLQASMPWILELALSKTYFTSVDELRFRINYLCEKSPKKCHELNEVVAELKQ